MKRNLPLIVAFVSGVVILIAGFIPRDPFPRIESTLIDWFMIISSFAILLGQASLLRMNVTRVAEKAPNWQYYLAGIISFGLMLAFGLLWGMEKTPGLLGQGQGIVSQLGVKPFDYLFENAFIPLSSTMFSLLAFYIASAAYRAFIIRNFESNLLMLTAVIVMLGRTSFAPMLTGWIPDSLGWLRLPELTNFIMQYPNTAAQRAILISAALGIVGASLRIILGIERSYLGGGK
ncbi:MAG TPA: hypothetical protein PLQ80_03960 [Candidatus Syntrophosphaera sp.]|jgi:hypothetical protein|nr:hypothetical protein [Candidatus Syntrophosphaera sp.]